MGISLYLFLGEDCLAFSFIGYLKCVCVFFPQWKRFDWSFYGSPPDAVVFSLSFLFFSNRIICFLYYTGLQNFPVDYSYFSKCTDDTTVFSMYRNLWRLKIKQNLLVYGYWVLSHGFMKIQNVQFNDSIWSGVLSLNCINRRDLPPFPLKKEDGEPILWWNKPKLVLYQSLCLVDWNNCYANLSVKYGT